MSNVISLHLRFPITIFLALNEREISSLQTIVTKNNGEVLHAIF